jgi:DNA polymerase
VIPIVTLDFETYFDNEYTLKKMTTEAYVRDPRFEVHGCSMRWPFDFVVKEGAPYTFWTEGRHVHMPFDVIPWDEVALLCHHGQFEASILNWHFGIRPKLIIDTMAMGRFFHGTHISVSLDSLSRLYGLPAKSVPYDRMRGLHWEQMDAGLRSSVAAGCSHDVGLTWDLFCRMAPAFPAEEYALVDATVRMFSEPVLVGNTDRLGSILVAERDRKNAALAELGVTETDLRSDMRLIELLEAEGVEIEYKEGKNGPIPCFAKSDQFMRDLCDDDDPRVAALASARLENSSAIVETRTARLRAMSTRGRMCVYLSPYGAHTKRWSGGDKVNWQNFPRNGALGTAIEAAPGELIVVRDASQIECRILNYVAGQEDVVQRFANKEDPYTGIASQFYGHEVYKPADDDPRKVEMETKRGTGKQLELSCGYGAGGPTIQATAKKGTYGPPVFLTGEEALRARDMYRASHPWVVSLWKDADVALAKIYSHHDFPWRDILNVKQKRIVLPNGTPLIYDTLEWCNDVDERGYSFGWRIRIRKEGQIKWVKLYGAKVVENIIQALSRVHVAQAWLRCQKAGIRMVSMEHDKLIAVCREADAPAVNAYMHAEMCRSPDWLPGIPLDSDGYISRTLKK